MNFYEKIPVDLLIAFYQEINKNIEKGILTKNMYYELSLIISAAEQRGISLKYPCDFNQYVNKQTLNEFIHSSNQQTEDEVLSKSLKFRETV